jgi:hypothetical protein
VVNDHKFDNDKVVSIIGHAVQGLNLTETGLGDDKRKEKMLIFAKE